MFLTELERKNRRVHRSLLKWLEELLLWESAHHVHGRERKELIELILDKNGWAVWDIEELGEEITIDNADKLELDFKVIKNEVYVCFKGSIKLLMTFYTSDYNGNNYYRNEIVLDHVLDVDFKVKVFNSIDGGEILEDIYLELFTE